MKIGEVLNRAEKRICILSLLMGVTVYYSIFSKGFFEGFLSLLDRIDFKYIS